MTFAEEVLLLLLDDDTGYFVPIPEWKMSCTLAGAVLMELALSNRIDTDLESLIVVDPSPMGDDICDPVLEEIVAHPSEETTQFWIERIARRAETISDRAFERLGEKGILDFHSGGFWSLSREVSRSGRYPLADGEEKTEIKSRITRVLLTDEIPDPRDIAIIGLFHTCDGIRTLLEPDEYEAAEQRIELISGLDLIGRSITAAVRGSYKPPESLRAVRRRSIPVVKLKDVFGSRSFRAGNLPKFLSELSETYGPVYRLKGGGNDLVVLASAELNRWTGRKGRLLLRTRDYLQGFQAEWGTARSIASMDGADHFRMRKEMRAGCAGAVVSDRLDDVFSIGRNTFDEWGIEKPVPVETACQRLIGKQISELTLSMTPTTALLDELLIFEYRALLVHVFNLLPLWTLRTPKMKRYKAKVLNLYSDIHAAHTPAQREGKRRDLVDDLLDLHQADPQFLPETNMGFSFLAAIIAGHYTASALGFAIYEMLVNPDLHERLKAEADALFAGGDPVHADFTPEAIDVTHRFSMETLRLHPVIPVHRRTAMNTMEVDGVEIPPYSAVLIAFTAPHFMEKHFKDPDRFDIDRYLPGREEHRQAGAYAPFGTGTHICGGQRFTELLMTANLLLMAHHLDLEMIPANYKLKINPLPKLSVSKRFRVRVTGHRNPLAATSEAA